MKLYCILFLLGAYSCRAPVYIFTAKDGETDVDIIKNKSFSIHAKAITFMGNNTVFYADGIEWTLVGNDGYVIPVEIIVNNFIEDTLSIKMDDIKAYFKGNNKIYEGFMDANIDTIITGLQTKARLPIVVKFDNFNRNSFDKFTDLNNCTLEILFSRITTNKSIIYNKRIFFIGRMH